MPEIMEIPPHTKLLGRKRVLALVFSFVVLALAASRVDPGRLLATFAGVKPMLFATAVLLNGFLFLAAAMRWHLVLRLTDNAVSYPATLRSALAGHFFYVGLFGAIGGDSARSYYYSRWHQRPLAAVLATAPLDRLLGLGGLLAFALAGFALAIGVGGLRDLEIASGNRWIWLVPIAVLALCLWVARKSTRGTFFRQLTGHLLNGMRSFRASPRYAVAGLLCGVFVQLALSGVLAVNLQAVSPGPIEWSKLVWTLPLVSILGGLPVTVAGLGTREAAAIGLLGLYGVASELAMAASLMCLASSLFWALCGAILFWREDRLNVNK